MRRDRNKKQRPPKKEKQRWNIDVGDLLTETPLSRNIVMSGSGGLVHSEHGQLFLLQRNGQLGSFGSKGSLRSDNASKS
jgi:hypothetical protein